MYYLSSFAVAEDFKLKAATGQKLEADSLLSVLLEKIEIKNTGPKHEEYRCGSYFEPVHCQTVQRMAVTKVSIQERIASIVCDTADLQSFDNLLKNILFFLFTGLIHSIFK